MFGNLCVVHVMLDISCLILFFCYQPVSQYANLSAYEAYTPLKKGTSAQDLVHVQLNRDLDGNLIYAWQRNTSSLNAVQMGKLILQGKMSMKESKWLQMRSSSGDIVVLCAGTINWNEYKKKYIMIGQQCLGTTSVLGEIWYSESDSILGPWERSVKIVSHHSIDFYNPMHHVVFDKYGGKEIFFEGTFVVTFDRGVKVPRYDYNQQMYKLDLSDPRLQL